MEITATQQMINEGLWKDIGNGKLARTDKAKAIELEK